VVVLFASVGVLSLNLALAEDEGARGSNPYKADLALISLPAASSAGCPVDTVRFQVTGDGVTSLGNVSVAEFVCLDPKTLLFTAQFTLSVPTGDRIFATASGYAVPTSPATFDVRGTWNFTGGTGRFEAIKGNGSSLGHVDLVTGASPHQLIGNVFERQR
jgi:hypothetical protein